MSKTEDRVFMYDQVSQRYRDVGRANAWLRVLSWLSGGLLRIRVVEVSYKETSDLRLEAPFS